MFDNERFETIKINRQQNYNAQLRRLEKYKDGLLEARKNNNEREVECYTKMVASQIDILSTLEDELNCIRPNTKQDLLIRKDIMSNFSNKVKESVPDNIPLVFHGNKNIQTVKRIIDSGGLFSPIERGIGYKSFATQVDVTYKNDIRVSLDFADSADIAFMPYGAIFVFFPKEDEYEKVLNTGSSSEVFGGVKGINFITEPERLFAIITTDENIQFLKQTCNQKGINQEKVMNHENFIKLCKETFHDYENSKVHGR